MKPGRIGPMVAVALIVAGCGNDLSFGKGAVRGVLIVGNPYNRLVEYSAPPLAELRSMPLPLPNGDVLVPLAADPVRGGFFAIQVTPSTTLPGVPPASWSLHRYDANWTPVASRTGAEVVGTDSMGIGPVTLTPNGQFLVVQDGQAPDNLVVLDATTLAVIRTITASGMRIYTGWGPTGTTGSQVLMRRFGVGCGGSVIWLDVATTAHVDSASIPCAGLDQFGGALAPGLIYVMSDTLYARLELYDAHLGQVVATQDTLSFPFFFPDNLQGLLIEPGGGLLVLVDAHTLKVSGTVATGSGPSPRTVRFGVVDPGTGAFFATTFEGSAQEKGFIDIFDGIMVVDMARRRVVVDQASQAGTILR